MKIRDKSRFAELAIVRPNIHAVVVNSHVSGKLTWLFLWGFFTLTSLITIWKQLRACSLE